MVIIDDGLLFWIYILAVIPNARHGPNSFRNRASGDKH